MKIEKFDIAVVGAGPAGLAAAREIRKTGSTVIVLEREAQPGGIPRHCQHTGFGIRDLHRIYSGPTYANRCVELAVAAGAEVRAGWAVTDVVNGTDLITTSRMGRSSIQAGAILLATGCRERPRSARLIPGDRPAGVLTTGALQQFVYLNHERVGRRAVVVGAEHIAFSAVHTLATHGTQVAAVVTESPVLQTYRLLATATAGLRRVPILINSRLSRISGHGRLDGIEVTDVTTGAIHRIDCDTVVLTADWIPDNEIARKVGVQIDPKTRGPVVDAYGRTNVPGIFSAGNLIHPAEQADVAALDGHHVTPAITTWLQNRTGFDGSPIAVGVRAPLAWVTPQLIRPGQHPPRGALVLRASGDSGAGEVVVDQGGKILHRHKVRHLVRNRPLTLRADWLHSVDWTGGPINLAYRPSPRETRRRPGDGLSNRP